MTVGEGIFVILAFFSGAVPYAVWISKFALHKDVREFGDGNPGAFNALRAGGLAWGGLVLLLEISKSAVPVGLAAQVFNVNNLGLVLIAVAPPFGHAFSPFLSFRGGKAIAATVGTWIGLSIIEIPVIFGMFLVAFYLTITSSAWTTMFTMVGVLVYMLLTAAPSTWITVWCVLMPLLIYKHRAELTELPRLKLFSGSLNTGEA